MSETLVPPFRLLKFPKPVAPAPTVLQAAIAKLLFEVWQEPQPR